MKMSDSLGKIVFPQINRVILTDFSLYTSQRTIDIRVNDGVFCLAGANGLGKSTFLSAVNYALTGIVPDPKRGFESSDEFYLENQNFADVYFTGRITDTDRETAEITIQMQVGVYTYLLTRGLFEPRELRRFSVCEGDGNATSVIDTSKMTPGEMQQEFAKLLVNHVGLNSFDQFVFIQHYILTFDEQRHLLFWNNKVLEQSLFLAFGVDPREAKEAGNLRREVEKAESRARNFQWEATQIRQRVAEIEKTVSSMIDDKSFDEDLEKEHKSLSAEHDKNQEAVDRLAAELSDARLKFAEYSSQENTLRYEYSEEFSRHLQQHSILVYNPVIVSSLAEAQCGLCGTTGESIVEGIQSNLDSDDCPLCSSMLIRGEDKEDGLERLKQIDADIDQTRKALDELRRATLRIESKLEKAQRKFEFTKSRLEEFESKNRDELTRLTELRNKTSNVEPLLAKYQEQIEERLQKKEKALARRDEKKAAYSKLQRKLEKNYADAEEEFVPLFKGLASSFLGLDLDITMETRRTKGTTLVLDVKGSARRALYQLSESQRFFIDIALRMALARYMSAPEGKACLFIDTPEGSLDIAYESRAGDMLAKFAKQGHNLVMTANINTSQLLITLAEQCSSDLMTLCQMTTWTDLSDVQIEEEARFRNAYQLIESALKAKKSRRAKR